MARSLKKAVEKQKNDAEMKKKEEDAIRLKVRQEMEEEFGNKLEEAKGEVENKFKKEKEGMEKKVEDMKKKFEEENEGMEKKVGELKKKFEKEKDEMEKGFEGVKKREKEKSHAEGFEAGELSVLGVREKVAARGNPVNGQQFHREYYERKGR